MLMFAARLAIPLTFGLSGLGVRMLVGVLGPDATNYRHISLTYCSIENRVCSQN